MEEVKFDIDDLKKKLLRKYPAFGATIVNVKYKIVGNDHIVKTAATDGENIYVNKEFISGLSEDEQLFIFAHEICHIALQHISRSTDKIPELWNIATDAVINKHLEQDGLSIPEGGIDYPNALKYDAEELYNLLLKIFNKRLQESKSSNNQISSQKEENDQNKDPSQNNSGQSQGDNRRPNPSNNQEKNQNKTPDQNQNGNQNQKQNQQQGQFEEQQFTEAEGRIEKKNIGQEQNQSKSDGQEKQQDQGKDQQDGQQKQDKDQDKGQDKSQKGTEQNQGDRQNQGDKQDQGDKQNQSDKQNQGDKQDQSNKQDQGNEQKDQGLNQHKDQNKEKDQNKDQKEQQYQGQQQTQEQSEKERKKEIQRKFIRDILGIGDNDSFGHDDHTIWQQPEKIKEYERQQEQKGKEQQQNQGQQNKEKDQGQEKKQQGKEQKINQNQGQKEQGQEQQNNISEKDAFEKNKQEKIRRAKEIMEKLKGKRHTLEGDTVKVNLGDVGKTPKPIVNWKKTLIKTLEIEDEVWGHKFSDKSNGYAARIEDVEYDEMSETEIILDTSGSVSIDLLKNFLRQVKTVLKNSTIKVGTFSNNFHGFVEIKKESDIDNLVINIGGGTNFDAASRAFTKRKDVNKICFTDGIDSYSDTILIKDKRKDIVWISFANPNFKPDYGKVIFVTPDLINMDNEEEQINLPVQ